MSITNIQMNQLSKSSVHLPDEILLNILEQLIDPYSLEIARDGENPVKFTGFPDFLLNIKIVNYMFNEELTKLLKSRFDGRLAVAGNHPGRVLDPVGLAHNSWVLSQTKELTLQWSNDFTWSGMMSLLESKCTPNLQKITLVCVDGAPVQGKYYKTLVHGASDEVTAQYHEDVAIALLANPEVDRLLSRDITIWLDAVGPVDEDLEERDYLSVSVKRSKDGTLIVRPELCEFWTSVLPNETIGPDGKSDRSMRRYPVQGDTEDSEDTD